MLLNLPQMFHVFYAILVIFLWFRVSTVSGFITDPGKDFFYHEIVKPMIYASEERKDLLHMQDLNADEVTVEFRAFDKNFVMNLHINRNFLPKNYFVKYQSDGNSAASRPMKQKNRNHCYYHGYFKGLNTSWTAISLCNGVSGVIYDGEEIFYIEPENNSSEGSHFIFKGSDRKPKNRTCGVKDHWKPTGLNYGSTELIKREKTTNFKIPYTSNEEPLIVETLYFISNSEYRKYGQRVESRSLEIANLFNAVYAPLNIYVVLIGIVIWDRQDEIDVSSNSLNVLLDFLKFREEHLQDYPNDNAILFSSGAFAEKVVGKAFPSRVCTDDYSGEIIADDNDLAAECAMTAAHELGHNFGMYHDEDKCNCPSGEGKCIMSPQVVVPPPTRWSDCSLDKLREAIANQSDYCLKNKPAFIEGPICGNGIVEDGEQCDCGPERFCKNRCCNAQTCRLAPNAICATGRCCDLQTCQMKYAGMKCRNRASICDLPEFCDGSSEFCPENVYRQNGFKCGRDRKGFCYNGKCNSHEAQCKLLWGPTGQVADQKCFAENTRGTRNFNCGMIDKKSETFRPCDSQDTFCGRLQCVDSDAELQLGNSIPSLLESKMHTTFTIQKS